MNFKKFALLFILMVSCKPQDNTLPILSFKINEEGIKEYYTVTYEGFVNQFNQSFTTNNIKGKLCIANFFFTRCPSICPAMREELIKVADALEEYDDFMILSHTIDMSHDSVDVLHRYWEATEVPATKWQFLRASESITKAQAKQFMTNFRPNEDETDFYHSTFVALIDDQQQIRGFYNTTSPEDMKRLVENVKMILN